MKRLETKFSRWKKRRVENAAENHQQRGKLHSDAPPLSQKADLMPVCPSSPVPSFPDGVRVIRDCHDAIVDVCFVHGLTGNRDSTWTAHGQAKPWPETLLPTKLSRARILTYGYDAYIMGKSIASMNGVSDHAANLLNDLTTSRASSNVSSRPLIFVAHSLGGLVCKEAILLSRDNPESHLKAIFYCIKGIIFLGTPHRGSWIADWAKIPVSALGLFKSINTSLLDALKINDKYLESLNARFWSMVREQQKAGRDIGITCFFEELPSPRVGKIVSKCSATLEGYKSVSIHANHSNMVKFSSTDDNGFKRLVGELVRWESQIEGSWNDQPTPPFKEAQIGNTPKSSFTNYGGEQFNAVHGTQNVTKGTGNQFPGAKFSGGLLNF